MHIITVGDIHGQSVWKKINPHDYDYIVFVGDYVDSYYHTDTDIENNLKDIIGFKNQFPEKIILLWGNHDLSYLYKGIQRHYSSGQRYSQLISLNTIFEQNINLFQAAFQFENHIWTHAGIVQTWFNNWIAELTGTHHENIASVINTLFTDYYLPLFHVSPIRGGSNPHGGIFWAHASETQNDPLTGYHQIVGHTRTGKGITKAPERYTDTSVTYVDCLDTTIEFYLLTI